MRKQRPFGSPPVIEWDEKPCPVEGLEGPCHIFRGAKSGYGYGHVGLNRKTVDVHQYVWVLANGPIPKELVIDHRCRVRACCNLAHLRLVTHRVNATENSTSIAAIHLARDHCKAGHPWDAANTRIRKGGGRDCRRCARERMRRYRLVKDVPRGNLT